MDYEAIAVAMMAEGHCNFTVDGALFEELLAGRELAELLHSEEVVQELDGLARKFEALGKAGFCEHIRALYGPGGSKLANLVSG
ncbi:MAG: hypothetical protein QNJ30_08330 [Kiloniellales bacterium]|nr:hypothetical protein [Kiloniellales bacterium]